MIINNRLNEEEKIEIIQGHFEEIMKVLEIEKTPSSEGTPYRLAKMYVRELFRNINNKNIEELNSKMKKFPASSRDEVKVVVPLKTMCEHHFLPFLGEVTVTYIPNEYIIGLSKIPRIVNFFGNKPQLQEVITEEIKDYLVNYLEPKYLRVDVEATHMCVEMRGVETPCVTYTTSEYKDWDEADEN